MSLKLIKIDFSLNFRTVVFIFQVIINRIVEISLCNLIFKAYSSNLKENK